LKYGLLERKENTNPKAVKICVNLATNIGLCNDFHHLLIGLFIEA